MSLPKPHPSPWGRRELSVKSPVRDSTSPPSVPRNWVGPCFQRPEHQPLTCPAPSKGSGWPLGLPLQPATPPTPRHGSPPASCSVPETETVHSIRRCQADAGGMDSVFRRTRSWRWCAPCTLTHPSHRRSRVSLGLPSLALLFLWLRSHSRSRFSSSWGSRWSTHRSFLGEGEGEGDRERSEREVLEQAGWWLRVLILTRDFSPEFNE